LLALATDESPEQTANILKLQARQAAWETASPEEVAAIRLKHQTAQRLLKPVRVCIPFAEYLKLPTNSLAARRAYPQLLGCIEAVALLRQLRKNVWDGGYVNATPNDYEIAYGLMLPILQRTFAAVSERALKLLGAIRTNTSAGQTFTRGDCARWAGVGLTEARQRIELLVEAGSVEQLTGSKGVKYSYKLVSDKVTRFLGLQELITPDQLRKKLSNCLCENSKLGPYNGL
jgi:hypothetical protein